jgi:hypothetical protein
MMVWYICFLRHVVLVQTALILRTLLLTCIFARILFLYFNVPRRQGPQPLLLFSTLAHHQPSLTKSPLLLIILSYLLLAKRTNRRPGSLQTIPPHASQKLATARSHSKSPPRNTPPPLILINIPSLLHPHRRRLLIVPTLLMMLQRRRRILRLRRARVSSRPCILLLLLIVRMRHVLYWRRRGVNRDQFDGPAVLVYVDGFWRLRGVWVVCAVGFRDGDVLDGSWVAVVGLVVVLWVGVRLRLRLGVSWFLFVDDAVAGWGAVVWWCGVDGCRSRGRCWLDVGCVAVVGVVLGVTS